LFCAFGNARINDTETRVVARQTCADHQDTAGVIADNGALFFCVQANAFFTPTGLALNLSHGDQLFFKFFFGHHVLPVVVFGDLIKLGSRLLPN
jgi:hypothetical protein